MCTQRIYLRRHYDIVCLRVNQRQQMSTPLLQWPLYFKLFVFLWIKSSWISGEIHPLNRTWFWSSKSLGKEQNLSELQLCPFLQPIFFLKGVPRVRINSLSRALASQCQITWVWDPFLTVDMGQPLRLGGKVGIKIRDHQNTNWTWH